MRILQNISAAIVLAGTLAASVAISAAAQAGDISQQQWVRVSASGGIQGRVVVPRSSGIIAVRDAKISLVDSAGKYAGNASQSDKTGRFTIGSVQPGVYTLIVEGENVFACCAMHVLNSDVQVSDQFEIAAGDIKGDVVRGAMRRYLPTTNNAGNNSEISFDPKSNPFTSDRGISGDTVRVRQTDGGLMGRLTKAGFSDSLGAPNANVMIFRDGQEVARTVTDDQGGFTVPSLDPGSYSVMGSGPDGFGLMGLELVDSLAIGTAAKSNVGDLSLVAQGEPLGTVFTMQVAPLPGAVTIIEDRVIAEREIDGTAIPFDGTPGTMVDNGFAGGGSFGGGGGGSFGGGGGGGGGGGLGRIGILGGIGAAIAIGLSDDDDAVQTPLPASPSLPVIP